MNTIKIKSNHTNYLHNLRREEINLIEKYLQNGHGTILEIGAGEGFQSEILKNYCNKLYCTDLNSERLIKKNNNSIFYKICDAEKIDQYFNSNTFDLVFSSNVFEHLPNPSSALKGIKSILKNDGLVINIIPNPFFDFTIILLHYPNYIITKVERILNKIFSGGKNIRKSINRENNLKKKKRKSLLTKLFSLPRPHGVSNSFINEIKQFSKSNWINLFDKEGFEIIEIIKGPVYSGYSFGLTPIKLFLEKLGACSEYIYVLKKK